MHMQCSKCKNVFHFNSRSHYDEVMLSEDDRIFNEGQVKVEFCRVYLCAICIFENYLTAE